MTTRLNERDKLLLIMSDEAIEEGCKHVCIPVRNADQCHNNKACRLLFDRDVGPVVVKELRRSVWSASNPSVSNRRAALEQRLEVMVKTDADGSRRIKYELNGKDICKSFFKVLMPHII